MCEYKDSVKSRPRSQKFIIRLCWYFTASNKNIQGKNKCCPFRNWNSEKKLTNDLREKYHILCVIRSSDPSIQKRSISIWVFAFSMDSLHHHNYKRNSSRSEWTSYMAINSSKIYLVQMQTAITITPSHSLIAKTTW